MIILLLTSLAGTDPAIKENNLKDVCTALVTNDNKLKCIKSIGKDIDQTITYLDMMIQQVDQSIKEH
tara:strand:- start:502 stop:702 length:201 start_codon:yes stop_codon:yes gene_type:complete